MEEFRHFEKTEASENCIHEGVKRRGRGEICIQNWLESLKGSQLLRDLGVDRTVLKWIFEGM
jgi:hypothetical protein